MSVGFKEKVVLSCPLLSGVITRRYKAGVCDGYHIGRLLARLARAACLAEDVHRRPEPHMSHVRDAVRLVGTKPYAIRDSYVILCCNGGSGTSGSQLSPDAKLVVRFKRSSLLAHLATAWLKLICSSVPEHFQRAMVAGG